MIEHERQKRRKYIENILNKSDNSSVFTDNSKVFSFLNKLIKNFEKTDLQAKNIDELAMTIDAIVGRLRNPDDEEDILCRLCNKCIYFKLNYLKLIIDNVEYFLCTDCTLNSNSRGGVK